MAIAAYNAGPHRVDKWIPRFGDPRKMDLHKIIDWMESIPYYETRNYVQRVIENLQIYRYLTKNNSTLLIDDDLSRKDEFQNADLIY